jgi:hypothetical protein
MKVEVVYSLLVLWWLDIANKKYGILMDELPGNVATWKTKVQAK